MMFELIKDKLDKLGAAGYALTEKTENRWEFYFVRHKLDQNRAVVLKNYNEEIFKDIEDGKYLGSASGEIDPTASEEEIDKKLADIYFQAGFVKNPAYKLQDKPVDVPDKTDPVDISAIAEDFIRAMQSADETETEDINSYEIFVKEIKRHFINSNGVTYTCTYPSSMIEVVINARREGHEIELYRNFTSGTCDPAKLKADVERAMQFGKDRLIAVPTPKLENIPVIFSNDNAVAIYDYFIDRMSAGFKVRKLSDWTIGEPVAKEMNGDPISIRAVALLPNSSMSVPVDEEGSVIRDKDLIKESIAADYWGSRQMNMYLGITDSSLAYNFIVEGGRETEEELRKGDYLEVLEFSDFQVDPVGGDLAGEIRLAYLYRNGEKISVTGGSLSGSMSEAVKDLRFSKETVQYDRYVIPKVTRATGLKITAAE